MKKAQRSKPVKRDDEMKAEYDFDYRKAKPNRFAGRSGKSCTVVVLDDDVSKVFSDSQSVNTALRAFIEIPEAHAQGVEVRTDSLFVELVDGRTITAPLTWYPRLWHGNERERAHFEIIGDGAYIHWPYLDEDLTVAGILAGRRSNESPASLKKWLASRK